MFYSCLSAIPSLFPFPAQSFQTPLLLPLMICCPAPVNLQIQEEDSSFSHHRQRALGYGRGSHNSGESPVLTRQNDRAEERPDSRADLLVHSLQTRTDTRTDEQTDTGTHAQAGPLYENNWVNQFILGRDFFQTVWVVSQSTARRENNEKFFSLVFVLMFGNNGNLGEIAPCFKKYCTHTKKAMISHSQVFRTLCSLIIFDLSLLSLIVK